MHRALHSKLPIRKAAYTAVSETPAKMRNGSAIFFVVKKAFALHDALVSSPAGENLNFQPFFGEF
jgi:hypothetical protein